MNLNYIFGSNLTAMAATDNSEYKGQNPVNVLNK